MQFISQRNRSYATVEEFQMRAKIFKDKLKFFKEHNSNPYNTHSVGINEFADWTDEEYFALLGYRDYES